MYFEEAFTKLKDSLKKTKVTSSGDHFAIQVRINDLDCGGTFYIEEKDGEFLVEPYNYYDFDVDIEASFNDLKSLAAGKLDIVSAKENGTINIIGDFDKFLVLTEKLKKEKQKKSDKTQSTNKKRSTKSTKKSNSKSKDT